MKNALETYGITLLGGVLHAVRVENDGARWKVTAMMASADRFDGETLESGRLFFGVDSRLAVIKKVAVSSDDTFDPKRIARFEMAQSLLEGPDQFYFDTLPLETVNDHPRFMAIAYHKDKINDLINHYRDTLRKPAGYKLDAVALAQGYAAFCRAEPGEVQVLADIETDIVTVAVLYKGKLFSVGQLETAPGEEITGAVAKKIAAECKLTLSFYLSELFHEGITVPLSRIIVSGYHAANDDIIHALSERFSAEVVRPQFHKGYFDAVADLIDSHPPERFLIPLGLAVT